MNWSKLQQVLGDQPAFRFRQAKEWLTQKAISDWSEAANLPAALRELLEREFPLSLAVEFFADKSGRTVKALQILSDGEKIETVLMRHADGRNTVCLSSQVGCPMGCLFCATGQSGFKRNLAAGEMVDQVWLWRRYLKTASPAGEISNVVFMGMGEPFLNYDNLVAAIRELNDESGFNIGKRRIAVSTVGLPAAIKKFAKEKWEVNLAVSLHAPNDELRAKIMPRAASYSLQDILASVDYYVAKTNRRVMFEYLLLSGVNDSPAHARQLAALLKRPLCFVNLLTYNQTGVFQPSSAAAVRNFCQVLARASLPFTSRKSFGPEIDAACGQLAAKKTVRSR